MADFVAWCLTIGLPIIAIVVAFATVIRMGNVIRYIPNDSVGIVEKIWSPHGSIISGFIALHSEAGYQPDVLRGGIHFFKPFMYKVHVQPLVMIGQGKVGYVYARDGQPLDPSQTLASNAEAGDFYDVRRFLTAGGQKGPQRKLVREGTHAINLAQFIVLTEDSTYAIQLSKQEAGIIGAMRTTIENRKGFTPVIIRDTEDLVGIVTVHDGPPLASGEIIAPEIASDHDNYQDADKFLVAGGCRGRQQQVIVEGTWFINRLFATIEPIRKTTVDVGFVGVVVSYTGKAGTDTTDETYQHGELVERGFRGVWKDPLLPGKYAFNTYAGKIIPVPTTNFVLKWRQGTSAEHAYDDNLEEISLITRDAFEPRLPLAVVLHIPYRRAPELIQRFGDVKQLVEQTLDPMVSSYFKNVGQQKSLIELLQQRAEIQEQANTDMKSRFAAYTLEFQEVLIGTPKAREGDATIETILVQLRQRQIADEQVMTYQQQQKAAEQERMLNEARAAAQIQTELTQSTVMIEVNRNQGNAALARAQKDAEAVKVTAEARARQIFLEGEATAKAAELQVAAYGGPEYRLSQEVAKAFFDALGQGHQAVVPQVLVNGGGEHAGGPLASLLAGLLSSSMIKKGDGKVVPFPPAAE
jgi:uncharacterized membrane protein YqiK